MTSAESGAPVDHEQMGCCTADCAGPSAAAVLPAQDVDRNTSFQRRAAGSVRSDEAMPSMSPAAVDPPPRASIA